MYLKLEIDFEYPTEVNLRGYKLQKDGNTDDIDTLIEAIKNAEKPILFVGGGVISSNTSAYIKQLTETTGIPVVESLMGRGSIPWRPIRVLRYDRNAWNV